MKSQEVSKQKYHVPPWTSISQNLLLQIYNLPILVKHICLFRFLHHFIIIIWVISHEKPILWKGRQLEDTNVKLNA
jgi:hypothetical protein